MSAALDMTPPATLEEFLDREPYQDLRHEWDGVQPTAMTGGTLRHEEMGNRLYDALRPAPPAPSSASLFRTNAAVETASGARRRYPDLVCARDDDVRERRVRDAVHLPEFALTMRLADLHAGLSPPVPDA